MTIDAKNTFREGWIMLKRPFEFSEIKQPIQHLSIMYAYSEKPLLSMEIDKEGKEIIEHALDCYDNTTGLFNGSNQKVGGYVWGKMFSEDIGRYEDRFFEQYEYILQKHTTVEVYHGNVVQCYLENQQFRVYPGEYKVIELETFNHALNSEEYFFMIENERAFNTKDMQDKIHYLKSRGVPAEIAKRFSSAALKDNVWFKPKPPLLTMFTRDTNIYLPDPDYTAFFAEYGLECPTSFESFFAKHGIQLVQELTL